MIINFLRYNKTRLFNVSIYLWAAVIPSLINVLLNPFLAKALSAKDFAIIGYYSSFNLIVLPFVSLSFINYYTKIYFNKTSEERILTRDTLLSCSLVFSPLLTMVSLVIFFIFAKATHVNLPIYPYLFLSFFVNIFGYYFTFYQTELKMQGNAKKYFFVTLLNTAIMVLLTVLLVIVFPMGAKGKFLSLLVASILVAIYCVKNMLNQFRIDYNILKDFFRFSWPIFFSSLLFYALSSIDRVFLEKIGNDYEFGLYNIAFQIISYISIISIAILQTFTPDLFKSIVKKDFKKLQKISFIIIFSAIIINLAFVPFAKFFISILTYGKFTEAYHYAQILAVRNVFYIIFFVFSDILIGFGLTKFELFIRILGALFSVIIYYYLIKNYGFLGASWAQSFVLIIPVFIGFIFFKLFRRKLV